MFGNNFSAKGSKNSMKGTMTNIAVLQNYEALVMQYLKVCICIFTPNGTKRKMSVVVLISCILSRLVMELPAQLTIELYQT